jgi:hypothetical protein
MFHRILIAIPVCATLALAEDALPVAPAVSAPAQAGDPVKPTVKKLDGTRYQVGEVVFDDKSREIRFPARVNMTEGQLEYLVVHVNGKVHESLLSTEISPTHLNLAFTLLRYLPSRELYRLPNETGGTSNKFEEVSADVKAAARVTIEIEWTQDGKTRRVPVNELIQNDLKASAMPAGPWVYGGSDFHEGKFVAETTGDVAAIFLSEAALLNYPGVDFENDDVWTPFPKRIPAEGTNVTLIIAPYQNTKPIPKP